MRHNRAIHHFNPRSREGSDAVLRAKALIDEVISIHAPAKGATHIGVPRKRHAENFNPRSREGSDPRYLLIRIRSQYFNPRSREGSDIMVQITSVGIIISIHAPAKGATAAPPRQVGAPIRFQSTLPRRERPRVARRGRVGGAISIHAPAKGATCATWHASAGTTIFQSTLPRRERPITACVRSRSPTRISIHAPAKGATIGNSLPLR